MGWDGRALLGRPSRIPHRNWKILFVLAADEYIERLEGNIRECLFFYVKIFQNNSVNLVSVDSTLLIPIMADVADGIVHLGESRP